MNLGLFMRVLWRLVLCGLVVFAFGFLHFYLPSKDVVRVVGTDVKRMDVRSQEMVKEGAGSAGGPTRDVRFINTVWPDGKPRVYRNEETEWGFPWYFKFDSANLQTKAQDMVSSAAAPKWVTVKHYGWRIEFLTMFPNAVEIAPAPGPDYWPWPVFRTAVFLLAALGCYFIWRAWRRFRLRTVDPLMEEVEVAAAEAGDAAEDVKRRASGWWGRIQTWLDTWRAPENRRGK